MQKKFKFRRIGALLLGVFALSYIAGGCGEEFCGCRQNS